MNNMKLLKIKDPKASKTYQNIRNKIHSDSRPCMVNKCKNEAKINAHVLQKSNHILSSISEKKCMAIDIEVSDHSLNLVKLVLSIFLLIAI